MAPVVADNPDLQLLQGAVPPTPNGIDPSISDPSHTNQVDPNNPLNEPPNPNIVPNQSPAPQQQPPPIQEDDLSDLLKIVCDLAEQEDLDLRYSMLARAKRNEMYFNNIQQIVYDAVARDYRTLDDAIKEMGDLAGAGDIKVNNVYRAFAESLVAALSITPPAVEFTPDDADDPDDLETAEAYSHTSELVARHNKAQLILIKALIILFNQGVVVAYNFTKTDPAFGSLKTYVGKKDTLVPVVDIRCKVCAELLDSSIPVNQFNPAQIIQCPTCGTTDTPQPYQQMENIEEPIYESTPKTRSLYDVFGITAFKLPLYAKKQSDCGYAIFRVDDHIAKFQAVYSPDGSVEIQAGAGDIEKYERWARLPLAYSGTIPQHITTARYIWLRPWYFYAINDTDKAQQLMGKYPTGCMCTLIGDTIVEISHERMDDVLTISMDPKSHYIHAEPAGNALIPLQDVENDIFNLGVQSIEYGIPETFANPKTVNFEAYSKSPSAPGMLTKAMPPGPDKNIGDGFHTVQTATLSTEYTAFTSSLTAKMQFTTGAFPSIFGGNMGDKGSNTATEYTESRARALQRLQLTWQTICSFWGDLTFKAVKMFVTNMAEDEQFSKKEKGTYVNIFISKSSMNGRVGHVEPEMNAQLPQSWAQKKDFLMNLIQMNIPEIGAIMLHPNNAEFLKLSTGMTDIYIPGENDFEKQNVEYYELAQGQPNGNQSSVPIDLHVDDHGIHMAVLKNILVSAKGMQLYKTNPAGYQNCIAHYSEHEMAQQAKTTAPSGMTGPGQSAETAAQTTQG